MKRSGAATLALAAMTACASAPPSPGDYHADLCVATGPAQPSCGPVEIWFRAPGRLRLRFDDIVYHLRLDGGRIEVVLMHGAMQIDGFVATYEWAGERLRFADLEKTTRYEVRLRAAAP